jgi:hypothetical protein
MRLRRVLGVDAIETTPRGYRLRVRADEIDAQRFEQIVGRGQELLTLGEPERAAFVVREALDLWRGQPLLEIGDWEPGQIEAAGLEERTGRTTRTEPPDHTALDGRDGTTCTVSRRLKPSRRRLHVGRIPPRAHKPPGRGREGVWQLTLPPCDARDLHKFRWATRGSSGCCSSPHGIVSLPMQ